MTTTMNPTRQGAPTVQQFKARAERMFREANPDAADATIRWTWTSPACDDRFGGGVSRSGQFTVTAAGFRTRQFFVSGDATSVTGWMMVR